jgi:type I restriction enzyme M protein
MSLNVDIDEIRNIVYNDEDFVAYADKIVFAFESWKSNVDTKLNNIDDTVEVKAFIVDLAEILINEFAGLELINKYDVYEALLSYWNEVMADDVFVIRYDGYEAGRDVTEFYETTKGKDGKEKEKYKGWEGKIIPKSLIECTFFAEERAEIEALRAEAEENQGYLAEWIEEQSGEDANAGALVVMDPDNGAVLASASYPTFDLTAYDYTTLSTDPLLPLYNRALM